VAETVKAYRADPFSYAEARALSDALDLSEPVAITLVRRGYRTPEEARAFLDADETHPPDSFRSMGAAVAGIESAIAASERITVHGDFDVDGVCATAILVGALRGLGADCDWLIPDRLADGYGLSPDNVRKLAERGTKLLVTVDCGVTAVEEVELAKSLGIDVVVTDHHQPSDGLPDCTILHPSLDGYPFADLCGTAVAWKLAGALGAPTDADLDLVALATVADVVPLVGENRALVKRGLEQIRRSRRPGMRALLAASKCEPTRLDEGDLSFRLAPRINAAGRLYRADAGVELFLTADDGRADAIATELSRANGERRAAEREVDNAAEAARRQLPDSLREAPALVVAGEGWHPGVVGIVASRLVERHHRPAIVISLDGKGGARGSGRGIPGFDLLAGLEACSEHLVAFGGHRAAAGLELKAADLEAFREAFAAHAAAVLAPEDLVRTERIDAMVGGADLGLELAEELGRLAPFGMGNPGVRLLVPSARVRDVRPMGDEGKHARFSLHSGAHRALGVAFGRSSLGVGDAETVDAAVRLELNHWNGSVEPRVVLREVYPCGEEPADSQAEAEWWERFEAELGAAPGAEAPPAAGSRQPDSRDRPVGSAAVGARARRVVSGSAAACLAELACAGGDQVPLALVADLPRRSSLRLTRARVVEFDELVSDPGLAARHEHVVLVDPPHAADLAALAEAPYDGESAGYLHVAWGDAERDFALAALASRSAGRDAVAGLYRDLRGAGEAASGAKLLAALQGQGRHPRRPEAAARSFRVLRELGLVEGEPSRGAGCLRVVSSEKTELERSATYRAQSARFQEGRKFLEGLQQS
jgi:single-stranded-DNA-specific exonuclease